MKVLERIAWGAWGLIAWLIAYWAAQPDTIGRLVVTAVAGAVLALLGPFLFGFVSQLVKEARR